MSAGNVLSVVGSIVEGVSQTVEGVFEASAIREQGKQIRYNGNAQYDAYMQEARNEADVRAYNAASERQVARQRQAQTIGAYTAAGIEVSSGSAAIMLETQATALEADVQERNRQSRDRQAKLRYTANEAAASAKRMQKALKLKAYQTLNSANLKGMNSVIGGIGETYTGGSGGGQVGSGLSQFAKGGSKGSTSAAGGAAK